MLLGWQPFWGALVQLNPTYQALPLGNKDIESKEAEKIEMLQSQSTHKS